MRKTIRRYLTAAGILLLAFIVFTAAVAVLDVRPTGPENVEVGFAGLNGLFLRLCGEHPAWDKLTDWMQVVAVLTGASFALLGLVQWIRRRNLKRVDPDLFVLAALYVVMVLMYLLFRVVFVNYRPLSLGEELKGSYPSSHVLLVLCVLGSAMTQLHDRLKNRRLLRLTDAVCAVCMALTVTGRLLAGAHWFTDILGSVILCAGLVAAYRGFVLLIRWNGPERTASGKE